jgi:hypothetical protein
VLSGSFSLRVVAGQHQRSADPIQLTRAGLRSAGRAQRDATAAGRQEAQLYLTRLDLAGNGGLLNILKGTLHGCGPDAFPDDKTRTSDLFFVKDSLMDIELCGKPDSIRLRNTLVNDAKNNNITQANVTSIKLGSDLIATPYYRAVVGTSDPTASAALTAR